VFHSDGGLATGPIALCEVQAYVYAAKKGAAGLARMLGDHAKADALADAAERLRQKFEDKFWQVMKDLDADAANCNVGKQPCRNGKLANMIMVPVADADQQRFKKLVQETVVKGWLKRAGADAAKEWNATVGRALGMEATQ